MEIYGLFSYTESRDSEDIVCIQSLSINLRFSVNAYHSMGIFDIEAWPDEQLDFCWSGKCRQSPSDRRSSSYSAGRAVAFLWGATPDPARIFAESKSDAVAAESDFRLRLSPVVCKSSGYCSRRS